MSVTSDSVQHLCHTVTLTAATHYANTQITLLYLSDGNLFHSRRVYIDARGKYVGGFVAQATFNTVCVLGTKLTDRKTRNKSEASTTILGLVLCLPVVKCEQL